MEKQIDDKKLKEIFTESKVIALVGASAKKDKTSHIVMKYLIEFGFEVIPVNPGAAGHTRNNDGGPCYMQILIENNNWDIQPYCIK